MSGETFQHIERLYGELGPLLLAYFRRHREVAGRAEDLLQDTFLRAIERPDRWRQAASARAYLFGIARHVCLDALRRQRPTDGLPLSLAAEVDVVDPRLEPLRAAIADLPEIYREPLLLKLQQELSYAEIAGVLDIPVGTVRSRLHHAVQRLQETMTLKT